MKRFLSVVLVMVLVLGGLTLVSPANTDQAAQSAADRLRDLQNIDGTWDWPLNNGNPSTGGAINTIAPIGAGIAQAGAYLGNTNYSTVLSKAGSALLSKTNNFSPSDGYFANMLDAYFGVTMYTDYVRANFYDKLAAGTYNRNGAGLLYNTSSYIASIYASRASWGGGNLAAWDVGMGLVGALAAGADTTIWIQGVKTEINRLGAGNYYDVIGPAGAIYALALAGVDFNPTSGAYASANNLQDMAEILVANQISSGGFSWISSTTNPGDETSQETAYAILALIAVNRAYFLDDIQAAADWLMNTQLVTNGWENYLTSGENNEITGEALWGVIAVYLNNVWVDALNGSNANFGSTGGAFATIQRGINTIEGFGGIVNVATGVYPEDLTISAPVKMFAGPNVASSTSIDGSISIHSVDTTIGQMRRGFSINGDITVGASIDASNIHINWSNLYGTVTNDGLNSLDATYNYWGSDGIDTIGDVITFPYLPAPVDTFLGVVDANGLDVGELLDWSYTLAHFGYTFDEIASIISTHGINYLNRLLADINAGPSPIELAINKFGIDKTTAQSLLEEYGTFIFCEALSISNNMSEFMMNLMGYKVIIIQSLVIIQGGDVCRFSFKIYNPVSGEQVLDPNFSGYVYLIENHADGTHGFTGDLWSYMPLQFDASTGEYYIDMPTGDDGYSPGPGNYTLELNLNNPGNDFGNMGFQLLSFTIE